LRRAENALADLAIGDKLVRKVDGPGAPGSAKVHPGNPGQEVDNQDGSGTVPGMPAWEHAMARDLPSVHHRNIRAMRNSA